MIRDLFVVVWVICLVCLLFMICCYLLFVVVVIACPGCPAPPSDPTAKLLFGAHDDHPGLQIGRTAGAGRTLRAPHAGLGHCAVRRGRWVRWVRDRGWGGGEAALGVAGGVWGDGTLEYMRWGRLGTHSGLGQDPPGPPSPSPVVCRGGGGQTPRRWVLDGGRVYELPGWG